MRSNSAVIGKARNGRSGMVIRAVVHFMEAASKKCWSAAGFCKLLVALSLGEQIEVSHRQGHVKTGAIYFSLQLLVEGCWEFNASTALDAATVTWFSG